VHAVTKYEFVYILDSMLDDAAVARSLEKYAKLIRDQGGEVTHQESWGRKKLAYEIRKKNEGTYLFLRMQATKAVVAELYRVLRFDEDVLRTLIVRDEQWAERNAAARPAEAEQPPVPPAPVQV